MPELSESEAAELHFREATRAYRAGAMLFILGMITVMLGAAMLGIAVYLREHAPTMHTRRVVTSDGERFSLEIPDGQCATARGVTICVPDPSLRKVSP